MRLGRFARRHLPGRHGARRVVLPRARPPGPSAAGPLLPQCLSHARPWSPRPRPACRSAFAGTGCGRPHGLCPARPAAAAVPPNDALAGARAAPGRARRAPGCVPTGGGSAKPARRALARAQSQGNGRLDLRADRRARSHVLFVDPYLDADDLQQFATATQYQGVTIRGLINPRPRRHRRVDPDGERFGDLMLKKIEAFRDPAQEFGEIDIRVSRGRRLHDRFLQIDDVIWHAGHSFNMVGGGEISLMTLVAQPAELVQALAETFAEAEPFESWWDNRPPPTWSLREEAGHQLRRLAKWIERPRAGQTGAGADD